MISLPSSKEVRLPDPAENGEEVKLLAFKREVLKVVEDYVSDNLVNSSQEFSNLSSQQSKGITDLRKKCKRDDLVIMETDKTKKLSIMTKENYVSVTAPHTDCDSTITSEELKVIERTLNGHTAQLTRAFMVAHNQGDFRRIKMATTNSNVEPPPLRSVRKDHKSVPLDQALYGPPSRPIGNGNNAPDSQLSWILARICKKAADSLNNQLECLNTVELLHAIDQKNDHSVPSKCCFC